MSKLRYLFTGLLFALVITGCAGPVTNQYGSDSAVSDSMEIGKVDPSMGMVDRQVIQTGSITLRVDEITESIPAVIQLAENLNGRVDDQSQYTDPNLNKVSSAYLLVRVPEENYQSFLDQVSEFGNVEALNTARADVTLQSVDLTARIQSLETSITRLEQLVDEASNVSDLIAAESALAERQAELNGLLSQQKYLADQVDMASIYVSLLRKDALDAVQPIGFWAGLEKGFQSILSTLSNSTTFIGLALPWVLLVLSILLLAKVVRFGLKKLRN